MVGSNDPYGYHQGADTPVLLEPTTEYFFYIYNDYNNFLNKYGLNHQLPVMNDISILETYPNTTPTAFNTLDNSIVRASFNCANGVECEGLMAGQVVNYGTDTYSVPGVDMGTYAVYNANGVIAPAGEFNELREQLMACLASFTFTEDYVRQAQQHVADETSAILAMSRQMQTAYDSYNAAWSARQTSYDIISQKNSDATLGYDRLYDPNTGETYRADMGFYDDYDINRDQYSNPNLQIIDGSTENDYLDGVDYHIAKYWREKNEKSRYPCPVRLLIVIRLFDAAQFKRHIDRHVYRHIDRHVNGHVDRHGDRHVNRHINRHIDRHVERQL